MILFPEAIADFYRHNLSDEIFGFNTPNHLHKIPPTVLPHFEGGGREIRSMKGLSIRKIGVARLTARESIGVTFRRRRCPFGSLARSYQWPGTSIQTGSYSDHDALYFRLGKLLLSLFSILRVHQFFLYYYYTAWCDICDSPGVEDQLVSYACARAYYSDIKASGYKVSPIRYRLSGGAFD